MKVIEEELPNNGGDFATTGHLFSPDEAGTYLELSPPHCIHSYTQVL